MSSALKRRFNFETVQPVGDVALEKQIILNEVGADLLVQGFLMGAGDVSDALAGRLDELLGQDGDFASLCAACASLNTLDEWQTQYGERGTYDYPALLQRCFGRVLQLLPSMTRR